MDGCSACFDGLDDPRDANVLHTLNENQLIAFTTFVYGGEDCSDMATTSHSPPREALNKAPIPRPTSRSTLPRTTERRVCCFANRLSASSPGRA